MNYPNSLSDQTVAALYSRAEILEHRWRNARLSDDFSGRMIDAVLRHLGRLEEKGMFFREREQSVFAVNLLEAFWLKNAKRDFVRSRSKATAVPIESAEVAQVMGRSDTFLVDDLAENLVEHGETAPVAWAFVLRRSGMSWTDVAHQVACKTGSTCTPAQVRQWGSRHFSRVEATLKSYRGELCA